VPARHSTALKVRVSKFPVPIWFEEIAFSRSSSSKEKLKSGFGS